MTCIREYDVWTTGAAGGLGIIFYFKCMCFWKRNHATSTSYVICETGRRLSLAEKTMCGGRGCPDDGRSTLDRAVTKQRASLTTTISIHIAFSACLCIYIYSTDHITFLITNYILYTTYTVVV